VWKTLAEFSITFHSMSEVVFWGMEMPLCLSVDSLQKTRKGYNNLMSKSNALVLPHFNYKPTNLMHCL